MTRGEGTGNLWTLTREETRCKGWVLILMRVNHNQILSNFAGGGFGKRGVVRVKQRGVQVRWSESGVTGGQVSGSRMTGGVEHRVNTAVSKNLFSMKALWRSALTVVTWRPGGELWWALVLSRFPGGNRYSEVKPRTHPDHDTLHQ